MDSKDYTITIDDSIASSSIYGNTMIDSLYDLTGLSSASSATLTISNIGTQAPTCNPYGSINGTYENKGALVVGGDAEINGALKVKGKDISQSLEKIEERLAILHPNQELEEKWENLRELRKQYMELEKEIIEKEKLYEILAK